MKYEWARTAWWTRAGGTQADGHMWWCSGPSRPRGASVRPPARHYEI
jgi:hypothetical protein